MGEAKFNPTALAAKAGLLPPKPAPISKRERDRRLYAMIAEQTGMTAMMKAIHGGNTGNPFEPYV